jgi:hypothetical protein
MIYTKQEIHDKIRNGDIVTFQNLFMDWSYRPTSRQPNDINKFEKLWEINMGDGREWNVAIRFINEDITVLLEGYYSSEGDSEFTNIGYGIPYQFIETRYKMATADEIRDMRIEEILK